MIEDETRKNGTFPDNGEVSPENIKVYTTCHEKYVESSCTRGANRRTRRDVMSNHVLNYWGGDNDNLVLRYKQRLLYDYDYDFSGAVTRCGVCAVKCNCFRLPEESKKKGLSHVRISLSDLYSTTLSR